MTGSRPGQPGDRTARLVSETVAGRLLAVATAAMPASRRDWGKALSAELAHTNAPRDQARLVLAGLRLALLQPGLAGYWRPASRSAGLAAIAFVPLGLSLYLTNVVFPSRQDNTLAVLAGDCYVLLALMAAGMLARRVSQRRGAALIAGVVAGVVLAVLAMATFALIDNAFLSIVSHQQGKITGLRESGLTSMRAYINADLEASTPGVAIVTAVFGAVFASAGGVLATPVAVAWSRLRGRGRGRGQAQVS